MAIPVTRLPDEPIVVVTFEAHSQLRGAIPDTLRQIIELRDSITEPVRRYFVIIDLTRYDFTFSDLVYILGELKGVGALRREDRPAFMMLVGVGGIIEMGVKALTQSQYGGYQSRLFSTMEEALGIARKGISEHA